MKSNLPPDSLETPRFCGIPTFMRLNQTREVDHVDVAILGIPSDSGSGYRTGARFGPNAIRQMSVMLRPINPYQGNINIFELCKIVDFGDVNVVPGYVEETFERITSAMDILVERGITPVGLGGDHLVTLPELRSVVKRHGKVALLHFDSHTDTWDSYFAGKRYSSGTPFKRAVEEELLLADVSVQVGLRGSLFTPNDIKNAMDLGFGVVTTDEMFRMGIPSVIEKIHKKMAGKKVFITFDMDFVDPASAPGIQFPEAGGPNGREVLELIRGLREIQIVGCDVVETNPLYDNPSQVTSLLAATIASEFLALIARRFVKR